MTTLSMILGRWIATNRAGLLLSVLTLTIGMLLVRQWPLAGWCVIAAAAVLGLGVIKFFLFDAQRDPPPGRRFLVDDVELHLFAEGKSDSSYPVIWIGGGHGEGLVMAHLHQAVRSQTRSILFDRAGAGWSAPAGPPLTIAREVAHLKGLLDAAGEAGPFVLAGHSFGGLFALNFAQRHPQMVAGLVVMDPTPPANVTWVGRLSFGQIVRRAPWRALALQFGIVRAGDPEIDDPSSAFHRCLAQWAGTINKNSLQPKSVMAEAGAFRAAMDQPFDMVNGEGALGSIPLVMLLANPSAADDAAVHEQVRSMLGLDAQQDSNFWSAMDESMDRQSRLSSVSRVERAPAGASHMFPYEYPQFVVDEVLAMARRITTTVDTAARDSSVH